VVSSVNIDGEVVLKEDLGEWCPSPLGCGRSETDRWVQCKKGERERDILYMYHTCTIPRPRSGMALLLPEREAGKIIIRQ
jgi:hypothetical protein